MMFTDDDDGGGGRVLLPCGGRGGREASGADWVFMMMREGPCASVC